MKISKMATASVNPVFSKYVFYEVGSNNASLFKSIQKAKDKCKNTDGVLSTAYGFNDIVGIFKDGKFFRSGKKFEKLKSEIVLVEKFEFNINPAIAEVGNFPLDIFDDYVEDGVKWKVYSKDGYTKKRLLVRERNGAYTYSHSNEKLEGEITYKDKVAKYLLIERNGVTHEAVHWYTRFDEASEKFLTWVLCKKNNTVEPFFIEQEKIIGWKLSDGQKNNF